MQDFENSLSKNGYCIIENLIPPSLLQELKNDLEHAIEAENEYHKSKNHPDFGMVLLCPLYGRSFLKLLEFQPYMEPFEHFLGTASIVYSYTSSSMPPSNTNYSSRIHTDCPFTQPEGYLTRMQALIALDDFTIDNGATYVLPASHNMKEMPESEYFFSNSVRLTMSAGSVWYANPRIWHAGGSNSTDNWRHGLTTVMSRAYMKQRMDIPRILTNSGITDLSDRCKQKLGFYAQIPISYDEYYQMRTFTQPLE